MNLGSFLLVLTLSGFAFGAQAQKVDNKKGVTYVDGNPLLKIKGGSLTVANQPTQILNYSNDKLLFVTTVHLQSSSIWYNEIVFADFDISFKTRHLYRPMIKSMYENGVFNGSGEMDEKALEKWVRLFVNAPPADWDF